MPQPLTTSFYPTHNKRINMDTSEMFDILQTCIIGNAVSACGLSYNIEDRLEVYHIDEVAEEIRSENVNGEFYTPTQFLEYKCGTNIKRVCETLTSMEISWKKGKNTIIKTWMVPISQVLWKLGKDDAKTYISDMFEYSDMEDFIQTGNFLFG